MPLPAVPLAASVLTTKTSKSRSRHCIGPDRDLKFVQIGYQARKSKSPKEDTIVFYRAKQEAQRGPRLIHTKLAVFGRM